MNRKKKEQSDELNEIDKKIESLESQIDVLRNQRAQLARKDLFGALKDGAYYRFDTGECTTYYFCNTPGNLSVQSGEGTVGYDGSDWVILEHAVKWFSTRTSSEIGVVDHALFHESMFRTSHPFGPREFFTELSKEQYEYVLKTLLNREPIKKLTGYKPFGNKDKEDD